MSLRTRIVDELLSETCTREKEKFARFDGTLIVVK